MYFFSTLSCESKVRAYKTRLNIELKLTYARYKERKTSKG